ncbi:ABC transporter ATP-binding protein [Clostridium sp. AM58-1XD]|uniref:ABC transporter ATP-binding protein n=1 Tax=Clostridium sp. AM58-1XD TaxID=2292307 RepID=UPI000E547675|nr:ABC transporter ATP-binding protein [Clostridium sp. AM58-1XD]RGY99938.1 ABC transporter ATP-binding protein [Clostridium sp. AM58-1XD]
MLNVKNVTAGYDKLRIVNGITIEIPDRTIVSIVGANGVGKTTLIKAIVSQIPVMSGQIIFDGADITKMPTNGINDTGITLVPEGRQLFGHMTVEENLDIGACTKKSRPFREKNKEEMYRIFPRLKERAKQMAGSLSGGEQQMVAMARAMMSDPKLVIMDEPSWGLAPILVAEMFETIERIREKGAAVLLVEQNVSKALQICDWGYVIEHGEVSMEGKGDELLRDEGLKKAYLGI